jgi:hypothetical protein
MRIIEAGKQRQPAQPKEIPANPTLVRAIIKARPKEAILDPLGNHKLSYFQEDQALLRSAIDLGLVPQLVTKFNEEEVFTLLDYFKTGKKPEEDEDRIEGLLATLSIEVVKLTSKK